MADPQNREQFIGWAERRHREHVDALFAQADRFGRCTNPICGALFTVCLDPSDPNGSSKPPCCERCHHLANSPGQQEPPT